MDLPAAVRARLSGGPEARARLAHVESVVATIGEIAAAGGWPERIAAGARRAAWIHDALKGDPLEDLRARIEAAGQEPDRWASAHGPDLLHAQAAAVWAASEGEDDPEVLSAVRHHPTAHESWATIGRLLYVADFCEPTRVYAEEVHADALRRQAGGGEAGLEEAARRVLALRLVWLLERRRAVHPDSWRAWNVWSGAAA